MPEELSRRYTTTDVAKFSRWYLEDYPVYVQEHPQELLVVGGEKGSHHLESTDEKLNLRHGLGVLLVRQIVEAHRGTMTMESAPKRGSELC